MDDNSPAFQGWWVAFGKEQVPEGRQNDSFVPDGTLGICRTTPTAEAVGYFQNRAVFGMNRFTYFADWFVLDTDGFGFEMN